jgi:hypothetical protein
MRQNWSIIMEATIESPGSMAERLRRAEAERMRVMQKRKEVAREIFQRATEQEAAGNCRVGSVDLNNAMLELGLSSGEFQKRVDDLKAIARLQAQLDEIDPAAEDAERDKVIADNVKAARQTLIDAATAVPDNALTGMVSPWLREIFKFLALHDDRALGSFAGELQDKFNAATTAMGAARNAHDLKMSRRAEIVRQIQAIQSDAGLQTPPTPATPTMRKPGLQPASKPDAPKKKPGIQPIGAV